MEKFICPPASWPVKLYRVQYPGCQTILSGDGLKARNTTVFYSETEIHEFAQSIIKQLTWGYRGAQPYITCFSDESHAENWALKEPWHNTPQKQDNWSLVVIDTSRMSGTPMFKLSELVMSLDLTLPDRALQHVDNAYLCLHKIPATAIVEIKSPQEVQQGTQAAAGLHSCGFRVANISIAADDRKYGGDFFHPLDGYSDSDYEAVENNLNDDLMKMIEGDWN
ncbi:MAG: hypothetical protein Q9213_002730 [Squamulea squamosa]